MERTDLKMNEPLVSVCIPVFNTVKYVKQTIDSVLAQQYSNIEILVQDNASTDGTWELLQSLSGLHSQIKIERNDVNHGMSWNWNTVIKRAQGDYVMILSADDTLKPEFLSICAKTLDDSTIEVVSTHYDYLLDNGLIEERISIISDINDVYVNFASEVLRINPFQINFTLFKKSIINKMQYDGNLFSKYVSLDYGLFLRIGLTDTRLQYIPISLGHYRIHESNTSNNQISLQWNTLLTLVELCPGLSTRYPAQYFKTILYVTKVLAKSFLKKILVMHY